MVDTFFLFQLKTLLESVRLGSGLKYIFHWKAQLSILDKSLFSSFVDMFMSCVTENKDVSLANSLALEDHFLDFTRSFIISFNFCSRIDSIKFDSKKGQDSL